MQYVSDQYRVSWKNLQSGTEDWIKKDSKTTLKTGKFTEISFALTMEASMNNQDWRCFGSSGGVTAFKSNSTKTYAYGKLMF